MKKVVNQDVEDVRVRSCLGMRKNPFVGIPVSASTKIPIVPEG